MDKVFVVVGPYCWGKGKSLKQALAYAKQNYAGRRDGGMPYNAYEASEDVEVNGYGHISARELKRVREVRYEPGPDGRPQQVIRVGKQIKGD